MAEDTWHECRDLGTVPLFFICEMAHFIGKKLIGNKQVNFSVKNSLCCRGQQHEVFLCMLATTNFLTYALQYYKTICADNGVFTFTSHEVGKHNLLNIRSLSV